MTPALAKIRRLTWIESRFSPELEWRQRRTPSRLADNILYPHQPRDVAKGRLSIMLGRFWLVGIAIGLVVLPATITRALSPVPPTLMVFGEGNTRCDTWLKLRRGQSGRVLPGAEWVLGYVTGATFGRNPPNKPDRPWPTIEHPEVDQWIDNYCAKAIPSNTDTLLYAAIGLVTELEHRAGQDR